MLASGTCNTTNCAQATLTISNITASAGNDVTICTGADTTLTATGGGTYQWNPGGLTTQSITVSPGVTTTYTVTVTVGSCTATDDVVVNVTSGADATITSIGPYCSDDAIVTLSAVNPGGSWSGPGITNTTSGLFDPSAAGVGTHQIIYTISGSCGDTDTALIQVILTPDATITPAGPFCSNESPVLLSATTPGGTWSGSGITNASTGQFSPSSVGVGTYQVIYTISGTCSAADTISIVVNSFANATITPAGPFCTTDAPVNLTAATAGGTWTGTGITNASNGTFSPSVAGTGTHQIIYTLTGACSGADTINIVVYNQADATIIPTGPFCTNEGVTTLTAATPGGSWSGNGITSATAGTFNPLLAGPGTHVITYTITGNCGDTDDYTVTVNPAPTAVMSGTEESCMGAGNGTAFVSVSNGTPGYLYYWNNTDTTYQIDTLVPGTYSVTVTDANNCQTTGSFTVNASTASCEPYDPHLYVPNIFSPNGDLQNDVLYVFGKGISSLEFSIFDRWGEKVFETKRQDEGWDGRYKGKDMDPAVFVYYLKAVLENDQTLEVKGNITLVR